MTLSKISIIDIHVHIGIYDNHYDFSIFYLKELCRCLPIEFFVCAPSSWQQSIDDYSIKSFEGSPSYLAKRSLFWLWISPVRNKSIEILELKKIPKGYVGIKLHPYADQYDTNKGLLRKVFKSCERWNVPLAIHTGNDGSEPLSICHAIPENYSLPVILFHSRPIIEAVEAAKIHSCIYLESSFCEPEDFAMTFNEIDHKRILFGSDYPLNIVYYPGFNIIDLYRKNIEELLNVTEKNGCSECFFSKNAKTIFKL